MTVGELTTDVTSPHSLVLDHAREFVELILRGAAAEYQRLLKTERFQHALEQDNAFNHGKLFAFAEFSVFRREFQARFPEASSAACINAFSSLFLKNDISMANLVDYVEGHGDQEQLLLNQPGE